MQFDEIEFHNVAELEQTEQGYKLRRIPRSVAANLNEGLQIRSSNFASGVELRFRIKDKEVKIHLRAEERKEAQTALIYFGSIQGGWQYSTKNIGTEDTAITIKYPDNMECLEEITDKAALPFSPYMVRVVLPYGIISYLGREGKTEPPHPGDMPEECYLAYGSSITHGSLALAPAYAYSFLIAEKMKVDYLNQGYAGTAHMEAEMAEYLVGRKDWSFATLEMGVNMLDTELANEEYEERIHKFLEVFKADGRPVFVTDIFTHNGGKPKQDRTTVFRSIVKRQAECFGLPYTPGNELLNRVEHVSADFTHPTGEGHREIAENWCRKLYYFLYNRESSMP